MPALTKKTAALTLTLALLSPLGADAAPLVKELADDVHMFSEDHYVSLVVVGDDGVLITDTAFTPRAESMKSAIAKITAKPVTAIVLSHEHYDHVGGTEVFPDAEIICHRSCQAVFDVDVLGIAPQRVDVIFDEFLEVDFDGPTVHLYNYGPADGNGAAVVQGIDRWTEELALPQYAHWTGYDQHLPAHIRRMALSIFHGG